MAATALLTNFPLRFMQLCAGNALWSAVLLFASAVPADATQDPATTDAATSTEVALQAELRALRDRAALFNEDELYQTLTALGERIAKLDAPALQQEFDRSYCRVAHLVSLENALDVAN